MCVACGIQLTEPWNEFFWGVDSESPVRTKRRKNAEILLRSGNILMILKVIAWIIDRAERANVKLSENPARRQICRLKQLIGTIPHRMRARLIEENSNTEIPF